MGFETYSYSPLPQKSTKKFSTPSRYTFDFSLMFISNVSNPIVFIVSYPSVVSFTFINVGQFPYRHNAPRRLYFFQHDVFRRHLDAVLFEPCNRPGHLIISVAIHFEVVESQGVVGDMTLIGNGNILDVFKIIFSEIIKQLLLVDFMKNIITLSATKSKGNRKHLFPINIRYLVKITL